MRLWPRSLAGQLALLITVALFAAQAINFALLLRERTAFRQAQATGPVATRIAEALEREARGERPIEADRGRVRRSVDGRVFGSERHPEVAAELGLQLEALGVPHGRIRTELLPRETRNGLADGSPAPMLIGVEQPGRGWISTRVPWPRLGGRLAVGLVVQTLVIYVLLLLPVLWIVRRLSQPLHDLTRAAEDFSPRDGGEAVAVRGPDDVAQLIAAFNALRLRVTAMLEEKDRMLGAIGHDLRTPLAALRVRIESVEDETDRERMADTVAEMNRTLDDILSLARLGRPSEAAVEVDVTALVDAVVEDFRDLGADVTFVEAERLPLRLRPSLVRRALRNLIENAVKYGRGAMVSVEVNAGTVAIRVADRGPGIPEDRLDDVFEAFTRLETSRNRDTGGIGLGLALARAIAREAKGDVTLANRVSGGLEATITLPRRT